jgi:hypothetical protein
MFKTVGISVRRHNEIAKIVSDGKRTQYDWHNEKTYPPLDLMMCLVTRFHDETKTSAYMSLERWNRQRGFRDNHLVYDWMKAPSPTQQVEDQL